LKYHVSDRISWVNIYKHPLFNSKQDLFKSVNIAALNSKKIDFQKNI